MDCSPEDSSVHGIFQARILEWVVIFFSSRSSRPRHWTPISCVFCTVRRILYHWATWEVHTWLGDQHLEECQHPLLVRIRRSRNSCPAGGNAKFYKPLWRRAWQLLTKLNNSTYNPAIHIIRYLSQRVENVCPYKNLHMDVYSSFVHMPEYRCHQNVFQWVNG